MQMFNGPDGGALVFSTKDLNDAMAAKAALAKIGITDLQGFVSNMGKAGSIAAVLGQSGIRTTDDLIERVMGAQPKAAETPKNDAGQFDVKGDVSVLSKRLAEAFMAFAR